MNPHGCYCNDDYHIEDAKKTSDANSNQTEDLGSARLLFSSICVSTFVFTVSLS